MATLRDDWYHLVPDPVVLKGLGQRRTFHCGCCGETYTQGSFRCCRQPLNMRSERWLELWCPRPEVGGCGKCPRHCQCPSKAARLGSGPLASLGRQFLAEHGR